MNIANQQIQNIANGNLAAFKLLFENIYQSLCIFSYKILKDHDLAADAAQEAIIAYWKKRSDFDNINSVKAFLYTVTKNSSINLLDKRKTENLYTKNNQESEFFFSDTIIEEETHALLYSEIRKLPPQTRKIIELSLKEIKNPEIAERLNISINTVKTLKKNGYKELRNNLKDQILALILLSELLF